MTEKLDERHITTIRRVLEALAGVEPNPIRAILACEDAAVALMVGGHFGWTTQKVVDEFDRMALIPDDILAAIREGWKV